MRFLISALGSAGDVHPFVAIGAVLLARGHDVTIVASPAFERTVERSGASFAPYGTIDEYETLLARAELWHPRRGARFIIDELLRTLPDAYAAADALASPATVLVGSTLSWGMRLVQEKRDLRGATVHLSPACLLSAFETPVVPGLGDVGWLPHWTRAMLVAGADRIVLDPMIAPRLNAFRATLGLAPVSHAWTRWMHSPDLVVGAWPDWYAPVQPDWPPHARTTGFPLFDDGGATLDADLDAFLDAGTPPVAITPGSAMAHGDRVIAAALDAAGALGRRALVVTPFDAQVPASLPSSAFHVAYAPFGALLPRVAALVHHGGIGTAAQALAAGIPHVVAPFAHDQPDNAARLRRIGVARVVKPGGRRGSWIAALKHVLDDRAVAGAVARAAETMRREPPAQARIADLLERLGGESADARPARALARANLEYRPRSRP